MMAAAIRFLLLGAQAAFVAWWSVFLLSCLGDCGGYAEAIRATAAAAIASIATVGLLGVHYLRQRRRNPERLQRQAVLQWWWLGVTFFIALLIAQ